MKREKVLRNINISRILEIFSSLAPHGASGLKFRMYYRMETGLLPCGESRLNFVDYLRQWQPLSIIVYLKAGE